MKILNAVTASLMLAAMPVLAHADDMSYRYFQLGYLETDIDGVSSHADGFGTRGAIGFAENFFLFTEYSAQEVANIDVDQYAVGLGGHYAMSDTVDLVGRAGWTKVEASVSGTGGGSFDDDGYLVAAGVRGQVGEYVQLEAGVIYQDFGGGSDDTGAELAARYHFNKRWAAAVEYQDIGELSTIMAGVRVSF